MSDARLTVLLAGQAVGQLVRGVGRRLSLHYDDTWRASPDAFPLSLSLPLGAAEHGHRKVSTFLWGLLPENALVLDRWARGLRHTAIDRLRDALARECARCVARLG